MARCKKLGLGFPNSVHVRLSDKEYLYIKELAFNMKVNESEVIRMIIDLRMSKNYKENFGYENKT